MQGIPNIGNSCYAASLIQCLRRSLYGYPEDLHLLDIYINGDGDTHSIWSQIDGNMHDSHEFYMSFMDRLPTSISKHFMIEYDGGIKMSYLPITTGLENGGDTIKDVSDIICIYRIPSPKRVSDFSTLEIDTKTAMGGTVTNRYKMIACICYSHGSNGREALQQHGYQPVRSGIDHYYALVHDGLWYRCDDSHITPLEDKISLLPIYMVFYMRQ